MPLCHSPHGQFKGHDIICRAKSLIIHKINAVLRHLVRVVGILHDKPHLLQGQHHVAPGIFAGIQRTDIKKTALFI